MYKLALFTFLSIVTLVGVNVLILEHLRDFKFSDLAPILLWINFNLLLILILLSVFVKKFYKEWRQESSPLKGKIFAFLLGIIGIPYVLITALAIGGKASYLRVFTDKTLKEIVIYADKLQRELNNLPPKEKEKLFKDLEHFKESVSTVRKIVRKQKVVLINFLLFFTLFFLVILIAAISFASWLAGAISSFIEELTKVTKEVAKGKFDVKLSEKEFPFSGLKELKELAQSFNEMVKSVGEAFKRLERDKILFEKIFQKVSTGVALFDNKDKELIKANEGYLKHFKFSNLEKLRRWVNGRDTLRYEELNIGRLTLVIIEDLMPFVINKRYRAWKEMAMGLAHDIKNPLNNILVNLSYLEYLLDRYGADGDCNLDELKKEFKGKFSSIERQINYISTLLDRFNEFATGEG
ncbi:MAG TPA: HAMP domain-containing protein, partial [Aquifex sp.]|nr:HAMP domain-containing protein [Aquifex sp.]